MIELSSRTSKIVETLFAGEEVLAVKQLLLNQCADKIPFCEDRSPEDMDQIRIAALKFSNGSYSKLKKAVELANIDWRDLIVAAGFGHDANAYLKWKPQDIH